jgi:hypothetical protein
MGRFDALTQLEEKAEKNIPALMGASPTLKNHREQPVKHQGSEGEKPANPQTRKLVNQSPPLNALDKPEKYTTRLEPSLIKTIRLHAIEKDMKDYEVVRSALHQYFERNR